MLQRDVADRVHRVEDVFVNWYLVEDGGRLTLFDAGVPRSWQSLNEALAALGRRPADIEAIVLTHAHLDHTGFAERARSELGVPVLCHEDELWLVEHPFRFRGERQPFPYLRRRAARRIVGRVLVAGLVGFRRVRQVRTFADGDTLDVPGSPRVVFTPGHTLGHCSFHLPERDLLISGDALVTLNPYTGGTGPHLVALPGTADSAKALASLDRVAATGAGTLLPGHGEPWAAGAEEAARQACAVGLS